MTSPDDRVSLSFRQIVLNILNEKLFGLYPYTVSAFNESAQTVDATPVRSAHGLPNVGGVPIRTPHMLMKLVGGEQVVIGFEGGDPSAPFVAAFDFAAAYAAALPAARQGDLAMGGGNGAMVAFYPANPAAPPTPFVPLATPMLVSFGSITSPPTPPPLQGPLISVVSSGSLNTKLT